MPGQSGKFRFEFHDHNLNDIIDLFWGPFSRWKGVPLQRAWTSQCLPFALQTWLLLGAGGLPFCDLGSYFLGIWYCFLVWKLFISELICFCDLKVFSWYDMIPGSSKKTTTHTYGTVRAPLPPTQCWAQRVYTTAFKKTTILVTGASHYNFLQHWVGGAGGAATALLDVDVVVFFEEPGMW